MKMSFVLNYRLNWKTGKSILSRKATMIPIHDMFENGKADIVLKTVNGFSIKRTTFIILNSENIWKLEIFVLVMRSSFNCRFLFSIWAGILKTRSFNLCPFLKLSVKNGPMVRFGLTSPVFEYHKRNETLNF